MIEDREKFREEIVAYYLKEHEELGKDGTLRQLEEGRQWNLTATLNNGGVIVFPHVNVGDCGQHVAATVHACLDSGADRVLVISVLHAFTDAMEQARINVANGGDPGKEVSWGIWGPGIEGNQAWQGDHALISFRHFWQAETKRRGIKGPDVIERFPYLAGGKPEMLPGIDELAKLAEDAVIVSTADPVHHGIAYGDPPEKSYYPDETGLAVARKTIEAGMALLEKGDYWGYNQHCVEAKSDARDAGQVFRYLRGPMTGKILDMTYSDASELYKQPEPSWVAAPLIEWTLV